MNAMKMEKVSKITGKLSKLFLLIGLTPLFAVALLVCVTVVVLFGAIFMLLITLFAYFNQFQEWVGVISQIWSVLGPITNFCMLYVIPFSSILGIALAIVSIVTAVIYSKQIKGQEIVLPVCPFLPKLSNDRTISRRIRKKQYKLDMKQYRKDFRYYKKISPIKVNMQIIKCVVLIVLCVVVLVVGIVGTEIINESSLSIINTFFN